MKKAASRVRDEKLLAAVRDRPVLYDQSMHAFKDFGAKNAAWKEVAAVVVGAQDKQAVERVKVRWKTLRDGFVRHLKKRKTLEMYTAATAMRPYKLEKQIEFLFPHVSFRDEDGDAEDDGGGRADREDTAAAASPTQTAADHSRTTNDCDSTAAAASSFDRGLQRDAAVDDAETIIYEQSVHVDRACNDALDRSIHFLCDQRFKAPTNYRLEDMDSVDAFFHAMAQTVKQLKPITVAKIKRAVSIIVSNAEIEEMETSVSCGKFSMTVPIIPELRK